MYKKLKNINKLSRIYRHYKTGKPVCDYMPLRLWIEPTDRCNLACPLCINRLIPPENKGDLDFTLYKKIIDQLEGEICDINLFHRGEPLLHPDITKMILYTSSKGLNTRIHTNATLLTREMSRSILQNGLNYISFSFDGFDKDTYEKNRTGAKFEQTLNNIISFLKLKKELKSAKTFSVLQIIDPDPSPGKKKEFLNKFRELPLDKISFRIPHNWAGGIPNGTQKEDCKKIVCTFPWYGLTVFRDGKVVVCCQDYEGEIMLGDLNKQDIKTIWNNKTMQEIRKDFFNKKYGTHRPCTNCDRIKRKTFLGIPKEYIGTFLKEAGIRTK